MARKTKDFTGSGRRTTIRRRLLSSLAVTALIGTMCVFATPPSGATPGTPGVPQSATDVFKETFENQNATATGIKLGSYTGGAAANTSTYVASPKWLPAAGQCNGWVLNAGTPLNNAVKNADAGCDTQAWTTLQSMGTAIGLFKGLPPATARTNQILSEFTNGNPAVQVGPGVEFQTAKPITTGIVPGHFYLASAVYAAANCASEKPSAGRGDPSLSFNIIDNQTGSGPAPGTGAGTIVNLATGLNPCTDAKASVINAGAYTYHVAALQSAAFRASASTTSLGLQLYNASGAALGNDSGFDDPSLIDATPQLDKVFSPSTAKVGQTSTLTLTITNTDDLQAKNGWTWTDNLPAGLTISGTATTNCPAGALTQTASTVTATGNLSAGLPSCTVSVPVTSATPGSFTNDATNITASSGVLPPGSTTVVFTDADTPSISLVKTSDVIGPAQYALGRLVTYSYKVTNTGNVPLSNVIVTEDAFSGSGTPSPIACPATALAPGANTTCTSTYTITQPDVDAGKVTNAATATGTPPTGPNVSDSSDTTISATPAPNLELLKTVSATALGSPPKAGDLLTYSFAATNNGNVTLTAVAITDQLAGISALTYTWPGVAGTLLPEQTVTATATYPITQADIEAGSVTNQAIANGTAPGAVPVQSDPATTEVPLTAAPALTLTKAVDASALSTPTAVGDVLTYTFTVKNTGNLALTGVAVTDQLAGLSALTYTWPGAAGALAPGQSATATATYAVTQDDIDAGHVPNAAIAHGTTNGGADTPSNEATTDTPLTTAPGISLVKTADDSALSDPTVVSDTITYYFTATNTGTVTLSNVSIADQLAGLGPITYSWSGVVGVLAPQQTVTASATYSVTQGDIDAGHVANSATATGTPPGNPPTTSPPTGTDTPLTTGPQLTLVKSASPSDEASYTLGQAITYSFVVTNSGTVTLSNISIAEGAFTGSGTMTAATCPPGPLAPNGQLTCTATYTLTQADINAGEVRNDATAHGSTPAGVDVPSNVSEAVIPASQSPAAALLKTASPTLVDTVGQIVSYSFRITNIGNVALNNVTVIENAFSGTGTPPDVTCPPEATTMLPGAVVTCTASYSATSADIAAGTITNTATVVATPPGTTDPVTTTPSTAQVPTLVPTPTPTPAPPKPTPTPAKPTPAATPAPDTTLAETGGGSGEGALALTGATPGPLLLDAAALILAGGLTLLIAHRRRQSRINRG
ncbi:conserved repeat domain-containing protein [Frankineae bacterium MT45]|nr:conserved repeat domain-containing protein [Frankineae bacterium MT45]